MTFAVAIPRLGEYPRVGCTHQSTAWAGALAWNAKGR